MKNKKENVSIASGDGGVSERLYEKIPCTIGYVYMRLEVDGTIRPCCISRVDTGNLNQNSLDEIWHSKRQWAFREKMSRINEDKFHLTDPEWAFCRQCSHKSSNILNHELMTDPKYVESGADGKPKK